MEDYTVKSLLNSYGFECNNLKLVKEVGNGLNKKVTIVKESEDRNVIQWYCKDHNINKHKGYAIVKGELIIYV